MKSNENEEDYSANTKEVSNGLENFGVEEESSPDLFNVQILKA